MNGNGHRPSLGSFDQIVRVNPARETEKAHSFTGSFDGLLRCYLVDEGRVVAITPIQFDDQGHAIDVVWTPSHVERFNMLLFVYEGRIFEQPVEETIVQPGQGCRLALYHMELVDKFGLDVIKR